MTSLARPVRIVACLSVALFLHQGLAQDGAAERDDAEINAAYQGCLRHFTGEYKKQLRVAQRAWIAFSNEQEAADELTGKNRGLAQDVMDEEALKEVRARTNQLRAFFILPHQDLDACRKALEEADADLTDAYRQSLASLSPEEQNKLREAERAWIEYRDQNSRAHAGDPSQRAPVWASTIVTRRRADQLRSFYGNLSASAEQSATPNLSATPTPLDPTTRGKLVADFRTKAAQLATKLAGQAWVRTPPDAFEKVVRLPPNLADVVANTASDARWFREKFGYDERIVAELKDDMATVDASSAYAEAASQLQSGNAVKASEALDSFHQNYPAAPGLVAMPLWQAVDKTRLLFERLHDDANSHITKASASADAGKVGTALQEYQKANQIFPDPAIAERIKTLREQSLGL